VNPYEEDMIIKLLRVGLPQSDYETLMTSYVDNVNRTLSEPIPHLDKDGAEREALKLLYRDREYFKTLEFTHDDIKTWITDDVNKTMVELGIGDVLNAHVVEVFNKTLEEVRKPNSTDMFDFFELIFGDDGHKSYEEWVFSMTWMQANPLKWLKRNWFHEELFWQEDPHCSGYYID